MDPTISLYIRGPKGSGKSVLLNAIFAQGINAVWTDSSLLTINVSKTQSQSQSDRRNNHPAVLDFSFEALGGLFPLVDSLKYRFVSTSGDEQTGGTNPSTSSTALYAQYTKHAR